MCSSVVRETDALALNRSEYARPSSATAVLLRNLPMMDYWDVLHAFIQFWLISFIALPFCYDISSKFRHYFKVCVLYFFIISSCFAISPLIVFSRSSTINIKLINQVTRYISHLLNIRWTVEGSEILKNVGPCVIISNSQHAVDILGLTEIWSSIKSCFVVDNGDLLFKFWIRWYSWCTGYSCVRFRNNNEVFDITKNLKYLNKKLWLFVKHENQMENKLQNLNNRYYDAIMKDNVPINTVVISNYYFLDYQNEEFDSGECVIRISAIIETNNKYSKNASELSRKVQQHITTIFAEISNKITPPPIEKLRKLYLTSKVY